MNGKDDAQNLVDAFEETKELYNLHFNQDYIGKGNTQAPKMQNTV